MKQTLASGGDPEPQGRAEPLMKLHHGSITFTWGREHYQPIQFHGFDVGPFELTIPINGEVDVAAVQAGAMKILDRVAEREYERKRAAYLERVKDLDEYMEAYSRR